MDKVQIYYCICMALGFIGTGVKLAEAADDPFGTKSTTHRARLYLDLASYILILPIAGRIFGWW